MSPLTNRGTRTKTHFLLLSPPRSLLQPPLPPISQLLLLLSRAMLHLRSTPHLLNLSKPHSIRYSLVSCIIKYHPSMIHSSLIQRSVRPSVCPSVSLFLFFLKTCKNGQILQLTKSDNFFLLKPAYFFLLTLTYHHFTFCFFTAKNCSSSCITTSAGARDARGQGRRRDNTYTDVSTS